MKNKTLLIAFLIIIAIIGTGVIVHLKTDSGKKEQAANINIKEDSFIEIGENNITIKSTTSNKIEKDGVEAEKIEINILGDQLEIKTTLKNNSANSLEGLFIEIELLDEKGSTLTTITSNSSKKIEKGKIIEIENYVMGIDNPKQIKNARIVTIEKSSVGDMLEQTFNDMTPDLKE